MSGYDEAVIDPTDADNAKKTSVRNMIYDSRGVAVDSETSTGKVSRFSDALRRIHDILGGGDMAKAGSGLIAGLKELLSHTQDLAADMMAWMAARVPGAAKGFFIAISDFLSGKSKSIDGSRLDPDTLERLLTVIRMEARGATEALPDGLLPAAAALGVYDSALALTRSTEKEFDALGRAISWKEITVTAAAPELPSVSQITITYQGKSNRMATYTAVTRQGDSVTTLRRDNYVYDELGRATIREVNFDGEVRAHSLWRRHCPGGLAGPQ